MQDQREIRTIPENHAFFEALGSKPRLQILSLLSEGSRSVSELAQELVPDPDPVEEETAPQEVIFTNQVAAANVE